MFKKILFIAVLVNISLLLSAQYMPWLPGSYNSRPILNKFAGTWRWTQASDTFEIKMQMGVFHYGGELNCDVEQMFGWLRYVKNGVLQQSSYQYIGYPLTSGKVNFSIGNSNHQTKQFGSYKDMVKNKHGEVFVTMLNNNYTSLKWLLRESRGIKSKPNFQWGFTVPTDLTLTRVL
jgi:hypothetical protein